MNNALKKIIFSIILNSSFLLILLIGIQNSTNTNKVRFIAKETIQLPVSFIMGLSFVSGSVLGSLLNMSEFFKKKKT